MTETLSVQPPTWESIREVPFAPPDDSGVYLWARRPRKRVLGGLCMIAGILLFFGLAVLLCL